MEDYTPTLSEEERAARRAQRAEARRQKQRARRQRQLKQLLPFCLVLVILVGLLTAWGFQHQPEESGEEPAAPAAVVNTPWLLTRRTAASSRRKIRIR